MTLSQSFSFVAQYQPFDNSEHFKTVHLGGNKRDIIINDPKFAIWCEDLVSVFQSYDTLSLIILRYYSIKTAWYMLAGLGKGPGFSRLWIWENGFRAGFRVAFWVTRPGENSDINYVCLYFINWKKTYDILRFLRLTVLLFPTFNGN